MKTTYFGLKTYQESMTIQDQAYELVKSTELPVVLGFEYYPVVTLGKRSDIGIDLNTSAEDLKRAGVDLVSIDRGGQATLHSPGQLVIYPLVPLKKLNLGVRDFVLSLEEATVNWLASKKIKAQLGEEAGVYTENGKIGFVGIRVDRGISKHGISINVNNDLDLFKSIRPCGVELRSLDSLDKHGVQIELKTAFKEWSEYFTERLLAKI